MLIIFGGLPGTGKSTIAREVARALPAVFLRVDVIEQAMRSSGASDGDIGPDGYVVAQALAESNLRLGHHVVADSVNPWPVTREAWRAPAEAAGCVHLEVEMVCTNRDEHRRRVESRAPDIPGLVLPGWEKVITRDYKPWPEADLRIDTARTEPEEAVSRIIAALKAMCGR
jgi:predicted kinase